MPQYKLTVGGYFEAALRIAGGEKKDESLHGRRFDVEVTVTGDKLDHLGMLIDERKLSAQLARVLAELDHCYLNEHPSFADANPTAENIARHICERMQPMVREDGARVSKVTVRLHPGASVSYQP